MQHMVIAALMLKFLWDVVSIVPLTTPCGVRHCRSMRTGAAVDPLGWLGLVAKGVCGAELALIPAWVAAHWLRHTI